MKTKIKKSAIITLGLACTCVLVIGSIAIAAPKEKDNNSSVNAAQALGQVKKQEEEKTQTNNAGEEKKLENEVKNAGGGTDEAAEEDALDTYKSLKGQNAQEHKAAVDKVSKNLKQVAQQDEQIEDGLEAVVQQQEMQGEQVVQAMNKVENQNKFKVFFIGTDYKNLGQLRSSLVHNENEIRTLTRLMTQAQDEESQQVIQNQIETMLQERDRIKAVISENEEGFSLLGWVFRFMNGYPKDSIDDEAEEQLDDEVDQAIEESAPIDENTDSATADETDANLIP